MLIRDNKDKTYADNTFEIVGENVQVAGDDKVCDELKIIMKTKTEDCEIGNETWDPEVIHFWSDWTTLTWVFLIAAIATFFFVSLFWIKKTVVNRRHKKMAEGNTLPEKSGKKQFETESSSLSWIRIFQFFGIVSQTLPDRFTVCWSNNIFLF